MNTFPGSYFMVMERFLSLFGQCSRVRLDLHPSFFILPPFVSAFNCGPANYYTIFTIMYPD